MMDFDHEIIEEDAEEADDDLSFQNLMDNPEMPDEYYNNGNGHELLESLL